MKLQPLLLFAVTTFTTLPPAAGAEKEREAAPPPAGAQPPAIDGETAKALAKERGKTVEEIQAEFAKIREKMKLAEERGLERRRVELVEQFRLALDPGEYQAFYTAVTELIYRFEGDPEGVLKELEPYLANPSDGIRYHVAILFVKTNHLRGKAVGTLLELMRKPAVADSAMLNAKREEPGGRAEPLKPGWHRVTIAGFLATYRIAEARDPIWDLYLETSDPYLFHYATDLRDERVLKEALAKCHAAGDYSGYTSVFARFQVPEATAALEAIHGDRIRKAAGKKPEDFQLSWALFRITGKQEYLDELLAGERRQDAMEYIACLKGEPVREILERELSGGNAIVERKAFLGLYMNHRDSKALKQYLLGGFGQGLRPARRIQEDIFFRVASAMNDPEVDAAAARAAVNDGRNRWRFYNQYRGDWPLADLFQYSISY